MIPQTEFVQADQIKLRFSGQSHGASTTTEDQSLSIPLTTTNKTEANRGSHNFVFI